MTPIYLTFVVVTAILAIIGVWYAPVRAKVTAYCCMAFLVISGPVVYFDLLSRPKLLTDEMFRDDSEAKVLAFYADYGKALYYWLQLPGVNGPRFYYEEWNEDAHKRAQALTELEQQGEKRPGTLALPFEKSYETEKLIHPPAQPQIEMKEEPDKVPEFNA